MAFIFFKYSRLCMIHYVTDGECSFSNDIPVPPGDEWDIPPLTLITSEKMCILQIAHTLP